MVNSHNKGSRWRHRVEEWFLEAGFQTTVRGIGWAGDDITVRRPIQRRVTWVPELILSVEAKNHREITLASFVDQATSQAHDVDEAALPVVVAHRRSRTDVDQAYVVMPGWAFLELVTR